MKTNSNMSMSDMVNFDKEVVNYINDNLTYIKEGAQNLDPKKMAEEALSHFTEGCEDDQELSTQQETRFGEIAERLFSQGFVEHAGFLREL